MWVQNGTAHTLYVNGTSAGTATATSNTFNTAVAHQISAGNTANFFNGYLAYVHFIDGQAKLPSAFGADDENGTWQPLVYAGGYGNNGFQLEMDDNSTAAALGTDTSGERNFGQRPFAYTAPSGFKALCTTNLPTGSITTSGSFTGNANADGPFVYLNGVPTAMTINSNAVTFATHADKLSNGFKLRTSSGSYNTAGSNTYSITTTGAEFKFARAQPNP
jgi:hypothetical protein